MLILNRDGSKKDWPSKVDMNKVLETPLPMGETTVEPSLEELKKQFNKGAKLEFFSSKKNSWQPCPNPTWKTTTKYRVASPPPKKYKTVDKYTQYPEFVSWIVVLTDNLGNLKPSKSPKIHISQQDAINEAQKLAKLSGNTYRVYASIQEVTYTTEQIEVNDE